MHYEKFNKDVEKILRHDTRGIDSPDTHKHSNENIDRSRTHLNYDLKDRSGLTAYQYHQKLIDEIKERTKARGDKAIRKDAVTLCSWVITAPKNLSKEKYEDFFKGVYKFFADRYKEKNIVTAVVHMDEVSPHMHFDFVPIVYDKKKDFEKLCARNLETPKTLAKAHKDLQNYLEAKLGCAVDILNGATVNGNKSVAELKLETTLKKLSESEQSLQEKQSALSEVTAQLQTATATVNTLQEQEQKLQKTIDEDVDLIRKYTPSPVKKGKDFLGRKKEVPKTVDELKTEKLILTARELLAQRDKILLEATNKARLVVSSAEATAQEIITKAENSEIVLTAKAEAEKIIQTAHSVLHEAEITRNSADDYFSERIALADEEAEERLKQLDEREAHINALAELSKPTAEYEEGAKKGLTKSLLCDIIVIAKVTIKYTQKA